MLLPTALIQKGESSPGSAPAVEDLASGIFDRAFSSGGSGRTIVLAAFEESIRHLNMGTDPQDGIREIAKSAALATARCHGNIIETGRVLLGSVDEMCVQFHFDARSCKENVLLGLAEGACQVGPIVYGRFLDIACEYRDHADEWILKNKRRTPCFEQQSLPVIVPFESELTLTSRPFQASQPSPVAPLTVSEPSKEELPEEGRPQVETAPQASAWSRPKGKGFFRRLSDVMGSFFGR